MTREEYEALERARIEYNFKLMENGVEFTDVRTAYIAEGVKIGRGTKIGPMVTIEGDTVIGEACVIGQNSRLKDTKIGDRVEIQSSVVLESEVGEGTKIGPFAYLRPNSKVGRNCKVGDFVEIKNSSFGDGSKAAHLTYIGDSDVAGGVNLGCGVVFVNYDGKHKFRSKVGEGAFIGCNVNLVSPVSVGEKAYIAAGSTVTEDIKAGALYIERGRGKEIEGWVEKKGLLDK